MCVIVCYTPAHSISPQSIQFVASFVECDSDMWDWIATCMGLLEGAESVVMCNKTTDLSECDKGLIYFTRLLTFTRLSKLFVYISVSGALVFFPPLD